MAAESEERVADFVEARSAALGYADPGERFRDERPDALMSVERKGVEPLAAVTAPIEWLPSTGPQVFGDQADWSDEHVTHHGS